MRRKKINEEKGTLTRKNFIKNASSLMAGTAIGAAGIPSAAAAAKIMKASQANKNIYKCPADGKEFESYEELKKHFTKVHPAAAIPEMIKLKVNGQEYEIQIETNWTLQHTLQYKLGLTGAKTMCDRGVCGSCTVIIDGRAVLSCITLAIECRGKSIETIEGIAANPKWRPLIDSYCKWDAMQCGYCTPGFVVSAKSLLDKNPKPSEEEIKQALAGNICICGTYPRHSTAVLEASKAIDMNKSS